MCWAQNFKLKSWHHALLHKLLQLSLSHFHAIIVEVVLQFLRIKDIKAILLMVRYWWCLVLWRAFKLTLRICTVRVGGWPVGRPVLVLRIGAVSLIGIRPLVLILVFKHRLNVFSHGLSELAVGVQRRTVSCVEFCVLVVHVHAASAWEISIAKYHALESAIILLLGALFSSHFQSL